MKNKIKVGILTFYDTINYGAALQAYALQQALANLGTAPEFLSYVRRRPDSLPNRPGRIMSFFNGNILGRISMVLHPIRTIKVRFGFRSNDIAFKKFQEEFMHCSREQYYDDEDFLNANSIYHGFVAGSDMVWTPLSQNLYPYYLQFADRCKRYSYSPSLTGCNTYSSESIATIKKYLDGFDYISCREQEGVEFVKSITGKDAELTVDPTLLFNKKEWMNLLEIPSVNSYPRYILCYTFGGLSKAAKKEVCRIAKEKNMDIRYVPMNQEEIYCELKKGYKGPYGPKEFVELFFNASFVVTNTFHGFLFSLISEVPFVVMHREKGNFWKANETRISNLMDLLGISNRFLEYDSIIDNHYLTLDYSVINDVISGRRQSSLNYLKKVVSDIQKNELGNDNNTIKDVRGVPAKECTGCNLCSIICPYNAISMEEDTEGFLVPYIDSKQCKECGKCVKFCPSIHGVEKHYPIDTKICLAKKEKIDNSASGGFFYTIAKYYIEHLHGVVFGVILDENFECIHVEASSVEEIKPMQNSKYIQSFVGTCYSDVKKRLKEGRYVLFSGTPCQVAALKAYLNKQYDNLVTIDIVCHGVPSPKFWRKYITDLKNNESLISYNFRNRSNKKTWNPALYSQRKGTQEATVITLSGIKHIPAQMDYYYGPFVRCESYRRSCYYCKYSCKERVADITMGDCDSEDNYPDFFPYDSKSIVLLNNKKGEEIWQCIKKLFYYTELDYGMEIKKNVPLCKPPRMPIARDFIYTDLEKYSKEDFKKKYAADSSNHMNSIVGLFIGRIK